MAGAHSFRGRPGKPAPEPMSSTRTSSSVGGSVGRAPPPAKSLLSPSASGDDGRCGCVSDWGGCVGSLDHAGESVRATLVSGNKWRARKKDSPKWRGQGSAGVGGGGGGGGGGARGKKTRRTEDIVGCRSRG